MNRTEANALLDLVRSGVCVASIWKITEALRITGDIARRRVSK